MVMVDTLETHEDDFSVSSLRVNADNIFCSNGLLCEPGLIENIAQTTALRAGYTASLVNEKVKKGYIGAVKRLKIYDLPKVDSHIKTTVIELNRLMNAAIVKGKIHENDKLLAECEMTIFTED